MRREQSPGLPPYIRRIEERTRTLPCAQPRLSGTGRRRYPSVKGYRSSSLVREEHGFGKSTGLGRTWLSEGHGFQLCRWRAQPSRGLALRGLRRGDLAPGPVVGNVLLERVQFVAQVVHAPLQQISNGENSQQLAVVIGYREMAEV